MPNPWEQFQDTSSQSGPWEEFQGTNESSGPWSEFQKLKETPKEQPGMVQGFMDKYLPHGIAGTAMQGLENVMTPLLNTAAENFGGGIMAKAMNRSAGRQDYDKVFRIGPDIGELKMEPKPPVVRPGVPLLSNFKLANEDIDPVNAYVGNLIRGLSTPGGIGVAASQLYPPVGLPLLGIMTQAGAENYLAEGQPNMQKVLSPRPNSDDRLEGLLKLSGDLAMVAGMAHGVGEGASPPRVTDLLKSQYANEAPTIGPREQTIAAAREGLNVQGTPGEVPSAEAQLNKANLDRALALGKVLQTGEAAKELGGKKGAKLGPETFNQYAEAGKIDQLIELIKGRIEQDNQLRAQEQALARGEQPTVKAPFEEVPTIEALGRRPVNVEQPIVTPGQYVPTGPIVPRVEVPSPLTPRVREGEFPPAGPMPYPKPETAQPRNVLVTRESGVPSRLLGREEQAKVPQMPDQPGMKPTKTPPLEQEASRPVSNIKELSPFGVEEPTLEQPKGKKVKPSAPTIMELPTLPPPEPKPTAKVEPVVEAPKPQVEAKPTPKVEPKDTFGDEPSIVKKGATTPHELMVSDLAMSLRKELKRTKGPKTKLFMSPEQARAMQGQLGKAGFAIDINPSGFIEVTKKAGASEEGVKNLLQDVLDNPPPEKSKKAKARPTEAEQVTAMDEVKQQAAALEASPVKPKLTEAEKLSAMDEARKRIAEKGGEKMHSGFDPEALNEGLDKLKGVFTSRSRLLLRDPEKLRFSPDRKGEYDGGQLVNRLLNGVTPGEKSMLEDLGIRDKFPSGEKVSAKQVDDWIGHNEPKIEVKKMTQSSSIGAEHNRLVHELDTVKPDWREYIGDPTRSSELSPRVKELMAKEHQARVQIESSSDVSEGRANWQSVAPKVEQDMPGYVEGAVTVKGDVLQPSSHKFPPNTLGTFRGYMETRPDGGKTFHVIEVQSDWAKEVKKLKEKGITATPKNRTSMGGEILTPNHPLLSQYERLALKAAIDHAKKEGADRIAISDAETAMMTQGHDLDARANQVDPGEPGSSELVIPREKGMRLHYDKTLPKILEELTGSKGEHGEYGLHKMAFEEGKSPNNPLGLKARPREDLVFKGPSGKPKTSISAKEYSMKDVGEGPYNMHSSKLYSGFDMPQFKDWKKSKDKLRIPINAPEKKQFEAQRAKELYENPNAKPLNSFRQVVAQPGKKLSASDTARNFLAKPLSVAMEGDKILNPTDVIYDSLGAGDAQYKNPLMDVRKDLDDLYNGSYKTIEAFTEPIRKLMKDHKMDDLNSARVDTYMKAKEENGIKRMIDSGVKRESIDEVLNTITPSELKLVKALRAVYDEIGPVLREAALRADKVKMYLLDNYTPWGREFRNYKPEADELATSPTLQTKEARTIGVSPEDVIWPGLESQNIGRTTPGSLISRKPKAKTPIRLDAIANMQKYVRDAVHYINFREYLKDTSKIVRDDAFAETYGDMGQKLIMEHLNTVARQGRYARNEFIDMLRRNTSVGVIAYRLPSQFVHLANIPLAMQRTGVNWWYKGMDEVVRNPDAMKFLQEHFAETFARGGGEAALAELSEHHSRSKLGQIYSDIGKRGFAIQRYIDQTNAHATVLGVYMKLLEEKGLDPNRYLELPIDRDAIRQARVLSRRAVASPIYKDLPPALTRGGSWTKSLMQFQTTFLDQWSNIRYDLMSAGLRNLAKNPKLAMGMFISIAGMLMTETTTKYGIKQLLHGITGEEDKPSDSYINELMHESLKRIPLYGQIDSHLMYGQTGIPSIDVVAQPIKEAKKYLETQDEPRRALATTRAVSSVLEAAGVPGTSQISDIVSSSQRAKYYKSHEKKLTEQEGRAPSYMSMDERIDAERKLEEGRPPLTREARARSAYTDIRNKEERAQVLQDALPRDTKNWLKSHNLDLPGYENRFELGKTQVHLTKDELARYGTYVDQSYRRAIESLRKDKSFDSMSSEGKTVLFGHRMDNARREARGRILSEISSVSKSEKDRAR